MSYFSEITLFVLFYETPKPPFNKNFTYTKVYIIFIDMKTYKIKSEDKAAFLNKLEKIGIKVGSNAIKDNKLEGYFTFTPSSEEEEETLKTIFKQSPKIDVLKEYIKRIIRKELSS